MKILLIALLLTGCAQAPQQTESFVDYMTPEEKREWLKNYISGSDQRIQNFELLNSLNRINTNNAIFQSQILNAIKH